jgi:CheY-like chemotaxis protein
MAFDRAGVRNPLIVLPTSEQAIEYLKGEDKFADHRQFPLPRLVFLNLHLPQIGGIEVLKWIRQQPALTGVVVIVITGSTHSPDVARA